MSTLFKPDLQLNTGTVFLHTAAATAEFHTRIDQGIIASDGKISPGTAELCRELLVLYSKLFPAGPKYGHKPMEFIDGPSPRAVINFLPDRYVVMVTCLHTRKYNQLIFQLGHEIAHHYVDPLIDHPFFEVIAVALSLLCLDVIANEWEKPDRKPLEVSYAAKVRTYKKSVVSSAVLAVTGSDELIDEYCREILPMQVPLQPSLLHNRSVQVVMAESMLRNVFESEEIWESGRLDCLTEISSHIESNGDINFVNWRNRVAAVHWPFTMNIELLFGQVFCSGHVKHWRNFSLGAETQRFDYSLAESMQSCHNIMIRDHTTLT